MQRSQSFSLRAAAGKSGDDTDTPQSELVVDGRPTGVIVPGITLEAQYVCADLYLLFTTENIPFEEALHVLLLDRDLRCLDHVELSHALAPGTLADLETHDRQARFSFFGADLWELTVLRVARRLTRRETPVGVRGRLRRRLAPRYLALARLR